MSLFSRVANVFRGGRLHAELEEEQEFHVEQRTRELIAGGMTPAEARATARRQFGNRLQLRERSVDAKALVWLESLLRDIRFSVRILRKERTVTVAAVLSLSLALGTCTAAFSLIDGLILRPLAVPRPHELVDLTYAGTGRPGADGKPQEEERFSYTMLELFRQAAGRDVDLFGATLSTRFDTAAFAGANDEQNVRAESLTGNGFDALGLTPAAGRLFTAEDDRAPEGRLVAVLSHAFWRRQFGGAASAVGQRMTLNGKRYQIVGVAQDGFTGLRPGYLTDVWVPLVTTVTARRLADPDADWVRVWGRMRPGHTVGMVREELQAAFRNYHKERAGAAFRDAALAVRSAATGQASLFRQQFRQPLWILGLISALILAIACSNVASLLIARGAARGREMALRIAIGAGRWRLMQQLLIESALLAFLACALGLVFAANVAPLAVSQLGPSDFPAYLDVGVDGRMFGFALLCAVVTAVAFGLAPALRASSASPDRALKAESGRHTGGAGPLRAVLSVQVAFSIAVLFLAGLLVTSFRKLMHVDLGFAKERVVLFDLSGKGPAAPNGPLLKRVRQIPGVQAAGLSGMALMSGAFGPHIAPAIRLPGRDWDPARPLYMAVSAGFFETMRIRLLAGREFTVGDSGAAIVNRAFARRYFGGDEAVGRRFEQQGDDPQPVSLTIVGVVADARYNNLREPIGPTVYTSLATVGGRGSSTLEVRTATDPRGMADALRRRIEDGGASLKVTGMTLQSARIDDTVISERLLAVLGGLFAAIALLLVTVGLYGVIRYTAARRQKEVGIRIALGARSGAVLRLVWSDVALPVVAGLAAGIAGGRAAARFLETLLYEVRPTDAASLAIPVVCILLTCAAAALPPAWRSARTDPMTVLRHE